MSKPTTTEEYINGFSGIVADRLMEMRETLRNVLPDAEEAISYGMPALRVFGKVAEYYAGYANHIGFYPTSSGIRTFEKELSAYIHSKGAVQFKHDQPLPTDLIERMALFRKKEIQ